MEKEIKVEEETTTTTPMPVEDPTTVTNTLTEGLSLSQRINEALK